MYVSTVYRFLHFLHIWIPLFQNMCLKVIVCSSTYLDLSDCAYLWDVICSVICTVYAVYLKDKFAEAKLFAPKSNLLKWPNLLSKKRHRLHYEYYSRRAKPPCSICFKGTPVNQHYLQSRLRLPKWHPQFLRYTVCPSEVVYSGGTWKLSSQKALVTSFCFP